MLIRSVKIVYIVRFVKVPFYAVVAALEHH